MKRSMCLYIPGLIATDLTSRSVGSGVAARDVGEAVGGVYGDSGGPLPDGRGSETECVVVHGCLAELGGWAQRFSPVVQLEAPDALLLDVTGCERLFRVRRSEASGKAEDSSSPPLKRWATPDGEGGPRRDSRSSDRGACDGPLPYGRGSETEGPLPDGRGSETEGSLADEFREEDGEVNLLRLALAGLRARGLRARGAIADTPGAAWAIAHGHVESAVVTVAGRDVEDLVRLSVATLRIDTATVAALRAVGVETIEALMYLPRSSLGSRFGDTLLHRLDQALGNVAEPLVSFQPQPVLRSRVEFEEPTDRRGMVGRALHHALGDFCDQLVRRMMGVTRLYVTFYERMPRSDTFRSNDGERAGERTFPIGVSRPTRLLKRLRVLVDSLLDQVRLNGEVEGVMVWTGSLEPLDDWQDAFMEDVEGGRDAEAMAELTDRLSARLGAEAVARVRLVSDHQPERAYEYRPVIDGGALGTSWKSKDSTRPGMEGREGTEARRHEGTKGAADAERGEQESRRTGETEGCEKGFSHQRKEEGTEGVRPLQVWGRPVGVSVVALVPEGPPALFRFRSQEHTVVSCAGPERVETGWWRGPDVKRDYFRVVTRSGQCFWMFRERGGGRWFIHGTFD